MSEADERCGYVTGFDGLTDCQSLILDILSGPGREASQWCARLNTKWVPTMQQMTSKYVHFLSTVIQRLRNVFGLHCVKLNHRIRWTVCFLSLLFNALYLYNHSAVGSFLDVLAFHILAGPDVCPFNVLFLSP